MWKRVSSGKFALESLDLCPQVQVGTISLLLSASTMGEEWAPLGVPVALQQPLDHEVVTLDFLDVASALLGRLSLLAAPFCHSPSNARRLRNTDFGRLTRSNLEVLGGSQ